MASFYLSEVFVIRPPKELLFKGEIIAVFQKKLALVSLKKQNFIWIIFRTQCNHSKIYMEE